jgi:hypothetical protein
MRVDQQPNRYPWWQLILLGIVGLLEASVRPLRRMWSSRDALDAYALVHMGSAGGDALVAVALAGSIFFNLPVGEAQVKVALYLGLTMAPLAVAGPLLVPLLDRAGPRRAISVAAAAGRALVCLYAAPRVSTLVLFPATFVLLVLSKVHTITKNGLTMAYAGPEQGLVRSNARLGRMAIAGGLLAGAVGVGFLKFGGASSVLYLAAAVYAFTVVLNLRLPVPHVPKVEGEVTTLGRMPSLTGPAIGAAGLRAASGFLLFLLAFSLRDSGEPRYWFLVLALAGTAGGFLGDLIAPRLPSNIREEVLVISCVAGAGVGAFIAFVAFGLPVLCVFAAVVGMATEFGRLAFQSLMQRSAPGGAHGRVFVRYEVLFQLAWVAGAFLPAVLPIEFREGFLFLAGFYLLLGIGYVARPYLGRLARTSPRSPAPPGPAPSRPDLPGPPV